MIQAIGIDAAFANMGLARVVIRNTTNAVNMPSGFRFLTPAGALSIDCVELKLLQTEAGNKKVVRVSSDDLRRCLELGGALQEFMRLGNEKPQFAFVEVPSGAQDAKAARALGMATGLLAVLHVMGVPIIEVAPGEVKAVVTGNPKQKASKAEIIEWAHKRWPSAPWVRYERAGKASGKGGKVHAEWKAGDLQNCNEHLADALATIAAGVKTPAFQNLLALNSHATSSPDRERPASRRVSLD